MTGPLGSRFWRLFTSSATSNLADGIGRTALPLIAASLTRDPVAISVLSALAFLPWLFFAIPSGAVVDRLDRRLCMLWANGFRAAVLAALAIAVGLGHVTVGMLYAAAFLVGIAETIYDSAARAMLPQVVRADQLDHGNSLLTTEETAGQLFVGAPVGSALFVVAAWLPLGVNAIGFTLAAALVGTLRGSFRVARETNTSIRSDIAIGMRWLMANKLLRGICVISGVTGLLQSMPNAVVVLFALQILHISSGAFGLLLVAGGIGGLAGGLLAPQLSRRFGRIGSMVAAAIIGPGAMGLMGFTSDAWLAGVLFAVSAGGVTVWNVLCMSVRQALISEDLFGRVQGAYRTVIWGAIPIGSVAGGLLAAATSLRLVFVAAGAAQVLVAFWMWALLTRHRSEIDSVGRPEPVSPGG